MPRITTNSERMILTAEPVDWHEIEPEIVYRIILQAMAGKCLSSRVAAEALESTHEPQAYRHSPLVRRPDPAEQDILRYCVHMHQLVLLEIPAGEAAQEVWQTYADFYEACWDRLELERKAVRSDQPPPNLYGAQGPAVREPVKPAPQESDPPMPRMDTDVMAGEASGDDSDHEREQEWQAYLARRKSGKGLTVQLSEADDKVSGSEFHMFRIRWWVTHMEWPEARIPNDILGIVTAERKRERRRRAKLSDALMRAGSHPGPRLPEAMGGRSPPLMPEWFYDQGLMEMLLVEFRFMCGVYPPYPGIPVMPFFRPNWRRDGWPACWDFARPWGRPTPQSIERALFHGQG